MKLIINLSNNLVGGGLQVALSFIEECKIFSSHAFHIFLGENVKKQIDVNSFPDNFIFYNINKVKFWRISRILRPLEKKIKPDCVFTVFGPSYWRPKSPHLMGYAYGHYIYYDYSYYKYISYLKKIKIKIKGLFHLFLFKQQADCFVVETDDAKERLKNLLNINKVYVVFNTCGSYYYNYYDFPKKLPEKNIDEIRLITITRYYVHKYLESIPLVINELLNKNIKNVTFTLTLEHKDYERIIPKELRKYVYNAGPINVNECPSLYKECDILYLPTLLETFSASYPEAMVMEKPILTSDLSFAHSICGNAALYFDPFSAKDIADKIELLINNNELCKKLVNSGKERLVDFGTANDRAKKYLNICENIVTDKKIENEE